MITVSNSLTGMSCGTDDPMCHPFRTDRTENPLIRTFSEEGSNLVDGRPMETLADEDTLILEDGSSSNLKLKCPVLITGPPTIRKKPPEAETKLDALSALMFGKSLDHKPKGSLGLSDVSSIKKVKSKIELLTENKIVVDETGNLNIAKEMGIVQDIKRRLEIIDNADSAIRAGQEPLSKRIKSDCTPQANQNSSGISGVHDMNQSAAQRDKKTDENVERVENSESK